MQKNKKTLPGKAIKNLQNATQADAAKNMTRPLNKAEQRLYNSLKRSFEQIRLHQERKIELRDARELLKEL